MPVLVALSCSDEEARRRVARRNANADRSLTIAPATFDTLKPRLEPLGADEAFIDPPF